MQPVQNIVDLLAFDLGVDPMSQELVAGLRYTTGFKKNDTTPPSMTPNASDLTSVLTCMTPSSVRVLVSITETPSAERSAKIF